MNYIRKEGKLPPLNRSGSKPMNGQESCEGINGQNTLTGEIRGKFCRELPAKKVNPKQVFIDMYGEENLYSLYGVFVTNNRLYSYWSFLSMKAKMVCSSG